MELYKKSGASTATVFLDFPELTLPDPPTPFGFFEDGIDLNQ
jgi:hypothetical protein